MGPPAVESVLSSLGELLTVQSVTREKGHHDDGGPLY